MEWLFLCHLWRQSFPSNPKTATSPPWPELDTKCFAIHHGDMWIIHLMRSTILSSLLLCLLRLPFWMPNTRMIVAPCRTKVSMTEIQWEILPVPQTHSKAARSIMLIVPSSWALCPAGVLTKLRVTLTEGEMGPGSTAKLRIKQVRNEKRHSTYLG